jgi:TonB family protein
MRRGFAAGFLVLLCFGAALSKSRPKHAAPTSFYATISVVSDAAPFWFDYLVVVTPSENEAKVELIRVAPESGFCSNITVKRVEGIIAKNAMDPIVRNVCAWTGKEVAGAVEHAKWDRFNKAFALFDSSSQAIVANCGGSLNVITLPLPEVVAYPTLPKAMRELREVPYRLIQAAFGSNVLSDGSSSSEAQDLDYQRAGAEVIERLRSGAYDAGFAGQGSKSKLSEVLRDYTGPRPKRAPAGRLLNAGDFHLAHFVAPVYPQIAKAARVSGQVKLNVEADQQTGLVTSVSVASGHPMLVQAATEAAQQWRFDSSSIPKQPVTAVIEFSLRCPDTGE